MTTVYPYAIVKTQESGSVFTGDRQLSTTIIQTFKGDKHNSFSPRRDTLVKNVEISKADGEIQVSGEEVFFMGAGIDKRRFNKKFELFEEIDEKGKVWTVTEVQKQIEIYTAGTLKLDDSQIKLGCFGLLNFLKRKKTFYIDGTLEVVCAFYHTYPEYVKKDKKGYFLEGYYKTSILRPFKFKTNNYRIEEF